MVLMIKQASFNISLDFYIQAPAWIQKLWVNKAFRSVLNSRHAGYSSLISSKFTPMIENKYACAVSYKKQLSFNIQASVSHIHLTAAPKRGTESCQNSNSVLHCICILFCNLDCLIKLPITLKRSRKCKYGIASATSIFFTMKMYH